MSKQLKKISILTNAIELQSLKALLAKMEQGGATKEELEALNKKVADILKVLEVDDTSLDTLKEIVEFIKANKQFLDALTIENIIGLKDALAEKATKAELGTAKTEIEGTVTALDKKLTDALAAQKTALEKTIAENKTAIEGVVNTAKEESKKSVEAVKQEAATNLATAKEEAKKGREDNFSKIVFGTEEAKKTIPTYQEGTHKEGTLVLDAEGNLCIVEGGAVDPKPQPKPDQPTADKKMEVKFEKVTI